MSETIKINRLPVLTWHHLRVNDAEVTLPRFSELKLSDSNTASNGNALVTGLGSDFTRVLDDSEIKAVSVNESGRYKVILTEDNSDLAGRLDITASEGQEVTVITEIGADKGASGKLALQTLLHAEAGSRINLIQVLLGNPDCEYFVDIGGQADNNAEINVSQIILGGQKRYYGCFVELEGNSSRFNSDIAYIGDKTSLLDINYVVRHHGKKTETSIAANGALMDASSKTFRGTIDFLNGASESKGNERENVLMIGDDVINKTVPLILCAEEDVEGNHGASIGEIDMDQMFYMMTRGLSKERAEYMMARAHVDSLAARIGDEAISEAVTAYLDSVFGKEFDE